MRYDNFRGIRVRLSLFLFQWPTCLVRQFYGLHFTPRKFDTVGSDFKRGIRELKRSAEELM